MKNVSDWVLGAGAVAMGVAGLFVAAHAGGGVGYYGGLAMFAFCVLFAFHLVRTACDRAEEDG